MVFPDRAPHGAARRRLARSSNAARRGAPWRLVLVLLCGAVGSTLARAERIITLDDAIALAEEMNPGVSANLGREEAARAGIVTARQFPNPSVEGNAGPQRPRGGSGTPSGTAWGVGIAQPIEYPSVRESRRRTAEANLGSVEAGSAAFRAQLFAQVHSNFYEVLQRQEQLGIAEEDLKLLGEIRDRVGLRAKLGESPRLDLVRTETEVLNAQRARDSAAVRVTQAKLALANLIGIAPDEAYAVRGSLGSATLPALERLREQVTRDNPQIQQALAEQERARNRLQLERDLRLPAPTLQAGYLQEPDKEVTRLGLTLPIPLFNRREGQIAEALAEAKVADAQLRARELALTRELDAAYGRFVVARQQVETFEGGLLERAQRTLEAAEAAYRFGERGILEYLDAQRTFRAVRQDYLNARYELAYSVIEIERLAGRDYLTSGISR
ncbi:MAG: TolC family protein [Burkholderiales bacterium]|nr:TolC family protein [Burkholderiales bacterium]